MKKVILTGFVCLLVVCFVSGFAAAQAKKATQKDAIDLVNKAAAYLKANGEAKAFSEFNKKDGTFTDMSKDLYVYVLDMTGKCLSHGVTPSLIGRDLSGIKDSDGRLFIKEVVETAKSKGSGWVDYNWSNPTTKKIAAKSTYVLKVADDRLIASGIYK